MHRLLKVGVVAALITAASAPPSLAQGATGFEAGGFTSAMPQSSMAASLGGFDRSRLSLSTSVSVGSGFGGHTQSLQLMSLRYQFAAPLAMSVSVGNMLGGAQGSSPFLESLSLRYQPSRSTFLQFEFHDVRSPLQLTRSAQDPFARDAWWGY